MLRSNVVKFCMYLNFRINNLTMLFTILLKKNKKDAQESECIIKLLCHLNKYTYNVSIKDNFFLHNMCLL